MATNVDSSPPPRMRRSKAQKIRVEDDGIGPALLASEIARVSRAAQALLSSRLTNKAIFVLIKDHSGVPMATIEKVLKSAADLEKVYTK